MTEREKIIKIIAPYVSAYGEDEAIADALIAANIGYVSEWKERAEKEKDEKNMWKCTANDWKQRFESRDKQYNDRIVSSCKALQLKDEKIAKYKRRAEVGVGRVRKGELKSFSTRDVKPYDDVLADALIDAVGKDSKCHDVCEEFAEETKKLMQRIFGDYIANEMSGFIDEIKEKMERKYGD